MSYPDACPACQPGIPDAALPVTSEGSNGGVLNTYACAACGTEWATWFDCHGWPIARGNVPVTPEEAARHRGELSAAMSRKSAA